MHKRLVSAGHPRSGFTLVELLVVIAIIGVLVALLLPAVQAARESARRTQCINNLAQIGIAVHNYVDTHGVIPPEFLGQQTGHGNWGANVMLFPYLEQQSLYDELEPDGGTLPRLADQPLLAQPMPGFRCPSDPGDEINTHVSDYGTSNYLISEAIAVIDVNDKNRPHGPRGVRFAQITDGLNHTFLYAERALMERPFRSYGGIWAGRVGSNSSSHFRGLWPPNTPWGNPASTRWSATSMHPGGANFALCDGAVRFVSQDVDSYLNWGNTNWDYTMMVNMNPIPNHVYQTLWLRDSGNTVGQY